MRSFNRLFKFLIKPWAVLLFIMLITLIFTYVDKPLANFFKQTDVNTHFIWISWLTHLGRFGLYAGGFMVTAYVLSRYKHAIWAERFWFMWLSVMFTGSLCVILKTCLGRARPELWFDKKLYGFYGFHTQSAFWSFPSGHTTTIMTVALTLSIILPRHRLIFILSGVLVALSRVFLTYHYLSDVLFAAWLVVIELGILIWFLQKKSLLIEALDYRNCHKIQKSKVQSPECST